MNELLNPDHEGDPSQYLEWNTTSLFALSIPQRLAEVLSFERYLQREDARRLACSKGAATVAAVAKEVEFGIRSLAGIDADLVVCRFGLKGNHATIQSFTRDAAPSELRLQAILQVNAQDADLDGVTHEIGVGDVTALTLRMEAFEPPVSTVELTARQRAAEMPMRRCLKQRPRVW